MDLVIVAHFWCSDSVSSRSTVAAGFMSYAYVIEFLRYLFKMRDAVELSSLDVVPRLFGMISMNGFQLSVSCPLM
jgi:hypothetical protein